jgi:hypothetical protein
MSEYLSPKEAYERYGLEHNVETPKSEIETQLERFGIAAIEMPLGPDDFKRLSEGMAVCIEECPDALTDTFYKADPRYGGEVGYVRKEKKFDKQTGLQTDDPKHYFHFMENSRDYWRDKFAHGPKLLRNFLEDGFEVHDAMITLAKKTVAEMENTHPNMNRLYFPDNDSFSFLRLLRYDGYEPYDGMGEVAKPHFDIGGVTIQAYADAPGFWAAKDGVGGDRLHYDTKEHEAYAFLGKGHEKVYGDTDNLRPLWHGVDRIVPAGVTFVPERTAVILFVDAPEVDYHVRRSDTLPQLGNRALIHA